MVSTQIPKANFIRIVFKSHLEKFPYNSGQCYLYLPCEDSMGFSSTEDVMGYDLKLPSCKPKTGALTLSTNENSRILHSYGLMVFV